MHNLYEVRRFFIMTTDPVHIGTGGMRLGRVDNSIVREPGTRLPKIPGTSLSGAIRQYAAYRYGKRSCAGKDRHCGRPTCPVCYTFGFVKGENGTQAHAGVVSIGDARLLLFPVYSLAGPTWVTSPGVLREHEVSETDPGDMVRLPPALQHHKHLNLGWLMLQAEANNPFQWPINAKRIPPEITERTVLVSDKLYSQIVNSNVEVRTSVSISPETGAADEGALFTYEAIPRAAVLWLDAVVDDYRHEFPGFPQLKAWRDQLAGHNTASKQELLTKWRLWRQDDSEQKLEETLQKVQAWINDDLQRYDRETMPTPGKGWRKDDVEDTPGDVVAAGLELAQQLGIGGMGTRGFGRFRTLHGR